MWKLKSGDSDINKDIGQSVEKETYDSRKATLEALKEQAEDAQREIDAIDKTLQAREKQKEAVLKEQQAGAQLAAEEEAFARKIEESRRQKAAELAESTRGKAAA